MKPELLKNKNSIKSHLPNEEEISNLHGAIVNEVCLWMSGETCTFLQNRAFDPYKDYDP